MPCISLIEHFVAVFVERTSGGQQTTSHKVCCQVPRLDAFASDEVGKVW